MVGNILDKRFVVLEEVGPDGPGVRYIAYDMTGMNRVHLRVARDGSGQLSEDNFKVVDEGVPLAPVEANPGSGGTGQESAGATKEDAGSGPKMQLVPPPRPAAKLANLATNPLAVEHKPEIPAPALAATPLAAVAENTPKISDPALAPTAPVNSPSFQDLLPPPGSPPAAPAPARAPVPEAAADPTEDPAAPLAASGDEAAPGRYTEVQDPSQTTQPIDLDTAEEVSAALETPAPPRPRIQTKVLEAAWFSQGDQLEEEEEDTIEVLPTPGQEDLERHARELTTDQYRKFSLDLSPPILPPVAASSSPVTEAAPAPATPPGPTTQPPPSAPPAAVGPPIEAEQPSSPWAPAIAAVAPDAVADQPPEEAAAADEPRPTDPADAAQADLPAPVSLPVPAPAVASGAVEVPAAPQRRGPAMSVAEALAAKSSPAQSKEQARPSDVAPAPPRGETTAPANLPSGDKLTHKETAPSPAGIPAPFTPDVPLVSAAGSIEPSTAKVTPPPAAAPEPATASTPEAVSGPSGGPLMAPGSMPAVTPAMIAANAVKADELHSAPSRSLKKQVLETYLPALIKTRLRTFFVGLVAGLLLAGIYALVTPSTAPAPAKECPTRTPRPASALEQPRAIVPTKARNHIADVRKAAAPVAADQQQAPVPRPRSISPRERRRVKSYLAKARRAAKKRQWRRTRVFAGKILKIQPVHKGAARLLALANKKTGR